MKLKQQEIRNLIEQFGWSEGAFAHKLGLDYSYVYRVIRGKRGIGPKFLSVFIKFCEKHDFDFKDYIDL